jgi:serine/threonine protein kinase
VSAGREGSLTQFVFRSDSCRCETPEVVDVAVSRTNIEAPPFDAGPEIHGEEIAGLDLPESSFPIDRFKPVRELGRGASGAVYLCIDRFLGTYVAVKTLHHLSAEQLLGFQQEARAISRLTHPNIVKILDFGATPSGIPYMVLEHIKGEDLSTFVQQRGMLNIEQIVQVVSSVCDALSYSHAKDIFHRDLKPSNMLIVESGGKLAAKLVDFGVARVKFETTSPPILEGTSIIGTPAYMSPDQMRGISFDRRSEVYSLGCILFELLTGQQIYSGETVMEIVSAHVNSPIPNLSEVASTRNYPERLNFIVERCLAKEPEDRYQSMGEVKNDLENLMRDLRGGTADDDVSGNVDSNSSGGDYSSALQHAMRTKTIEPSEASVEPKSKPKSDAAAIGAVVGFILLCALGLFLSNPNPEHAVRNGKTVDQKILESSSSPATLQNALLETKFQINQFDGNHWTFNLGEVNDAALDELFHAKNLNDSKRLWFDQGYISPGGLLKLRPLGVVAFAIIGLELSGRHLESLAQLTTLKALRLFENPRLEDKHLAILAGMPNLTELFIRNDAITDEGVASLGAMNNLKFLSLDRCKKLTDRSLDTIEKMTSLERLSMTETGLSMKGVHRIAKMKNLKTICISHLPCDSQCIRELSKLNPERLALRYAPLTYDDLIFLSNLKSLKMLDIRDTPIKKSMAKDFYNERARRGLPYCQLILERRTGISGFGEMVYETLDDEHMWTESIREGI